jgi:hypothetical protein
VMKKKSSVILAPKRFNHNPLNNEVFRWIIEQIKRVIIILIFY